MGVPGEDGPGVALGDRVPPDRGAGRGGGRHRRRGSHGRWQHRHRRGPYGCSAWAPRTVTVAYRRTRAEMPVQPEEIAEAVEEGIRFEFLVAPMEVVRDDGGHLVALRLQRMRVGEFDHSGRRRPVPMDGSTLDLPAATIVRAVGQTPVVPDDGPPVSKRGRIIADRFSLATEMDGVFAGGDAVLGPATAVEAIAHGRRAAEAMERYLHPHRPARFPVARAARPRRPLRPGRRPSDATRRTPAQAGALPATRPFRRGRGDAAGGRGPAGGGPLPALRLRQDAGGPGRWSSHAGADHRRPPHHRRGGADGARRLPRRRRLPPHPLRHPTWSPTARAVSAS
jgi:hypothetical protein